MVVAEETNIKNDSGDSPNETNEVILIKSDESEIGSEGQNTSECSENSDCESSEESPIEEDVVIGNLETEHLAISNASQDIAQNTQDDQKKDVTKITASLWKYFPIPNDEPDPFPEYITKYEKSNGTAIIGARVRGKKHKHEGTNCDDWFETANIDNIKLIAVSDGAGSKKYSRLGAKAACQASIGYLVQQFRTLINNNFDILENLSLELSDEKCVSSCKSVAGLIQDAVVKAYNAVESEFYRDSLNPRYSDLLKRNITIKDFSSTLLVAAIIPLQNVTNENLVISCQIGDGMIALINSSESLEKSVKLMGEADSGDFSGETDFIVNKKLIEASSLASRTKLSRGKADIIMLMSDGVADDYFPNETEMHRLYLDLVANGIIQKYEGSSSNQLSSKDIEIIRKLPKPITYPWVNDNSIIIGLNYTKSISEEMGISLEQLWNDHTIVSLASVQVKEALSSDDPAERLKIWLDNYVERGSFDDRTLVIAQI